MHYVALAQVLILLSLANGSPVIAKRIFGDNCAAPVDGNTRFLDGRPLVRPSKTVRGIVISLLVTALGAMVLGLAHILDTFNGESEMWSLISLCRWPMKMIGLLLAVLSIWLGIVVLAVLLGVFPDGNGVLHPFR
jgi:hypothetical protein